MEIKVKVIRVDATEQVTESFKKRNLIVEYADNPAFPQMLKLEALQDKVSILDNVSEGQEITAHVNLKGRESKGNVYNQLEVWKIS